MGSLIYSQSDQMMNLNVVDQRERYINHNLQYVEGG